MSKKSLSIYIFTALFWVLQGCIDKNAYHIKEEIKVIEDILPELVGSYFTSPPPLRGQPLKKQKIRIPLYHKLTNCKALEICTLVSKTDVKGIYCKLVNAFAQTKKEEIFLSESLFSRPNQYRLVESKPPFVQLSRVVFDKKEKTDWGIVYYEYANPGNSFGELVFVLKRQQDWEIRKRIRLWLE